MLISCLSVFLIVMSFEVESCSSHPSLDLRVNSLCLVFHQILSDSLPCLESVVTTWPTMICELTFLQVCVLSKKMHETSFEISVFLLAPVPTPKISIPIFFLIRRRKTKSGLFACFMLIRNKCNVTLQHSHPIWENTLTSPGLAWVEPISCRDYAFYLLSLIAWCACRIQNSQSEALR